MTTLLALVGFGIAIVHGQVKDEVVESMAKDVIEATAEPLLFPGERLFWMRQAWAEGGYQVSPFGSNDNGNACGVTQVNKHVIPAGMGTCEELRASRVLAIKVARVLVKRSIARCDGKVRDGLGLFMTGLGCGKAPKLVAKRCEGGAC